MGCAVEALSVAEDSHARPRVVVGGFGAEMSAYCEWPVLV